MALQYFLITVNEYDATSMHAPREQNMRKGTAYFSSKESRLRVIRYGLPDMLRHRVPPHSLLSYVEMV